MQNAKKNILNLNGCSILILVLTLSLASLSVDAGFTDLIEQSDKFDALDNQFLQNALDKALSCTISRDFKCAEAAIVEARHYQVDSGSRKKIAQAENGIKAEYLKMDQEERERIRRNEEARLAEEYRQAREEAQRRERERAEEDSESTDSAGNLGLVMLKQLNANLSAGSEVLNQINRNFAAANAAVIAQQRRERQVAADQAAAEAKRRQRESQARTNQATDERNRQQAESLRLAQVAANRIAERERAQLLELQRQKDAKDKADRLAKDQAEKFAQLAKNNADKAAQQKAVRQYLDNMIKGIRLEATKCLGGEGQYYATGTRPKIKPEVVECINVHFEAFCPGERVAIQGVATNFIGLKGCLGDIYKIDPKPSCPVNEIKINVTDVVAGCN